MTSITLQWLCLEPVSSDHYYDVTLSLEPVQSGIAKTIEVTKLDFQ